jgi:hypothetical protein
MLKVPLSSWKKRWLGKLNLGSDEMNEEKLSLLIFSTSIPKFLGSLIVVRAAELVSFVSSRSSFRRAPPNEWLLLPDTSEALAINPAINISMMSLSIYANEWNCMYLSFENVSFGFNEVFF